MTSDLFYAGLAFVVMIGLMLFNQKRRAEKFYQQQGSKPDYNYRNILGFWKSRQKLFFDNGDKFTIVDASQIRSIEKSSIMETKQNAFGFQIHKETNAMLTFHINDLDRPIEKVAFRTYKDLELWYSRLCTFCNLS